MVKVVFNASLLEQGLGSSSIITSICPDSDRGTVAFLATLSKNVVPMACKKSLSANGALAADFTSLETTSSSYMRTPEPLSISKRLDVPLRLLAAAGTTVLAFF